MGELRTRMAVGMRLHGTAGGRRPLSMHLSWSVMKAYPSVLDSDICRDRFYITCYGLYNIVASWTKYLFPKNNADRSSQP